MTNSRMFQGWFDGSLHKGVAGIGAWIHASDNQVVWEFSDAYPTKTINIVSIEYDAYLHLLRKVVELQIDSIQIRGDCADIFKQLNQGKVPKNPIIFLKKNKAQQLVSKIANCELIPIPRHENGISDKLSRQSYKKKKETLKNGLEEADYLRERAEGLWKKSNRAIKRYIKEVTQTTAYDGYVEELAPHLFLLVGRDERSTNYIVDAKRWVCNCPSL